MKTVQTSCPLDCWDQCAFLVEVDEGRIVSIGPDPDQPVTGNVICSKGKSHLERTYSPDRLLKPLLKKGGSLQSVSWPEALQAAAEKIESALKDYGPLSLLHFFDGGYCGTLKKIESRFFSALGGYTTHRGSLCWEAGIAAQKYDFGAVQSHPVSDLQNSQMILIWGRNPAATSIHLLPHIRRAREKGAKVILVDPVRTATAALADDYYCPKPATDGALALGVGHLLIKYGLIDGDFVKSHSSGFTEYRELTKKYTPDRVAEITGIDAERIEKLAWDYGNFKPAAILIGIGLQRHSNGGNTIRSIDALAALSGNIGRAGGGAGYANFRVSEYIDLGYLNGDDLAPRRRYYPKPRLAEALLTLQDPPIQVLYVSRANPLSQVGDSNALRRAVEKVPFVMVADHFLTDTARVADLVFPCTNFLEDRDLFYTSMGHPYLNYGDKAVEPPGECRSEYDFLRELSGMLGLTGFPDLDNDDLLEKVTAPLTAKFGIGLEDLKQGPLLLPGGDGIPWADRVFRTADGRYNFYSEAARRDGCDPLPQYHRPIEIEDPGLREQGYKYWFVTPHPRDSIHSTHRLPGKGGQPKAYINHLTARREGLSQGEKVQISSVRGSLQAEAVIDDMVRQDTVLVYEGWWQATGASVNTLTPDRVTDLGNQAAYYDCLCRIERL